MLHRWNNFSHRWADQIQLGSGPAHPPGSVTGRCFYQFDELVGQNVASYLSGSREGTPKELFFGIDGKKDMGVYAWFNEVSSFHTTRIFEADISKLSRS